MLKITLFALLAIVICLMAKTILIGRRIAIKEQTMLIGRHRRYARTILFFLLVSVALIELMVRIKGGVAVSDALFHWHIAMAILFLASIALLNGSFSGLKSKRFHGLIAYASLCLFLGTVGTAIPIILRL